MKQCYGYTRVSTFKQGDGVSLQAQRDAIEAFAARNQFSISQWFEEKVTAAKKGRPLFNQMVSALKEGKADGVVFHKIDRSARNFADWARIGDLSEAGVDIHFATESLDFSSRGGRLTADIQAVIAADYVRNLREECIKGINGRLKQGLYPFKAPLGYFDNGKGKVKSIDPVRGPLVRKMFELYASEQFSIPSLVPEMATRGLRSAKGKPLAKTSIEQMLRNPFYMGIMKMRSGKVYNGIHEPLISPELFERVASVRSNRDNKKKTRHNHLLGGLFRCRECQGPMTPERQKAHVYYRCHQKSCPTGSAREDKLEKEICNVLKHCVLTVTQATKLRNLFIVWFEKDEGATLAEQASLELAKINTRISSLTDKFIDDLIDETSFNTKKKELVIDEAKWKKHASQKVTFEQRQVTLENYIELAKNLYFTYQNAARHQKREIVNFATSNRTVSGKNVCVEPSKWVSTLQRMGDFSYCAHSKDTYRTLFQELDEVFTSLQYSEVGKKLHGSGPNRATSRAAKMATGTD